MTLHDHSGSLAAPGSITTGLDYFRLMLRIRLFEERCRDLREEGLVAGSIHLSAGQEAIPAGAAPVLRDEDRVVATYRGHGWAIAAGVPLGELLAEVCQRANGVNGGRGGSAYLMSPRNRLIGENSIVGAGVPIAAGVALAHELRESDGIVIVSIGDGATSQGAMHEGVVFAASRSLPLVIVCENNGWSEMTAIDTVVPFPDLAQRAVGYGIPGVTVDGNDPAAVGEAIENAAARARGRGGPTFVECKTARLWGHYNADVEHYRPKADKESAAAADPIPRLRAALLASGEAEERELEELEAAVRAEIDTAEAFARDGALPDPATARDHVVRDVAVVRPPVRAGGAETSYVLAVNAALRDELTERPEVVVFGEDVGVAGGVFGATRRLQSDFGAARVFDTPIAESSILGAAIGLAMQGFRPVVEIMWADFMLVAFDQLVNQAANMRYISRGEVTLPLVVRTQQGVTPGSCAQHSQSLEALLAHIPGLRVGLPATPQDAYSMLRAAIAEDDPCILIESRALYQEKGPLVPEADPTIGGARTHGEGSDAAIITWGRMTNAALAAADTLSAEGISSTVVDLRWLSPLDEQAIGEAVDRCGRVLVVHEANLTGGFGAEVAARIGDDFFTSLDAPVQRLASPDVRYPSAPGLQDALLPNSGAIVTAVKRLLTL
jgi:2-oxoisovalerate dehydrogenase E1 component